MSVKGTREWWHVQAAHVGVYIVFITTATTIRTDLYERGPRERLSRRYGEVNSVVQIAEPERVVELGHGVE